MALKSREITREFELIAVQGHLLLPSCKKLEFKTVSVDGLGSGMGKW